MRSTRLRIALGIATTLSLGLAACDGSTATSPDMATVMRPPLGQPITASQNSWTWVDFPDSSCDDGTPTGMAINLGDPDKLLVYMMGGGACWDYQTCFVLHTASQGPYGKAQFDAESRLIPPGTVFDRNAAGNPFATYTMVFVPYCTGDLHAGNNVAMYVGGGGTHPYHHHGRANLEAYLPRIAGTVPNVTKLVVSGSSAGGYGAALNYELFRRYFPDAKGYLVDDSGPLLEGADIPSFLVDAMYKQWKIGDWADALCATCKDDVSQIYKVWSQRYPKDRLTLLSSLRDMTIKGYLLKSAQDFQDSLERLAHEVLDPLPNFHYFFVDDSRHTMLGDPANHVTNGVDTNQFLTPMITDDPAWKSIVP